MIGKHITFKYHGKGDCIRNIKEGWSRKRFTKELKLKSEERQGTQLESQGALPGLAIGVLQRVVETALTAGCTDHLGCVPLEMMLQSLQASASFSMRL